jgi:UDP-3-O-[3-hydroxymyristoyl] glucosamine N-acyltransferase
MEATLKEISDWLGGSIEGDPSVRIRGAAGLAEAGPGEITFLSNPRYLPLVAETGATALLIGPSQAEAVKRDLLPKRTTTLHLMIVEHAYYAFCLLLERFHPVKRPAPGVSDRAVVGKGAEIGTGVTIFPFVTVSDGARIGDRAVLYPGVYVGEAAVIGEDTLVYPNVTIRERVRVGNRVILHSGVVLGSDGFGFATRRGKHRKIPQVGTVVVEDDVEIGANVTVDRATMGETRIRRGTKIDNLVQIAHNVTIGEDCLIVAQAGISGSSTLGNQVTLAGQVGLVGHIRVGDGVQVGARSVVTKDIGAGLVVSGFPAMPHREWLTSQAVFPRLPEMRKRIHEIEQRLMRLETRKTEKTRRKR